MIARSTRKKSFFELEALPPDLRDLAHLCHPRLLAFRAEAGKSRPGPGLAPESALRLHPCRALSSAPVSTSVEAPRRYVKSVVVADGEE
jgi:hypothetical protein